MLYLQTKRLASRYSQEAVECLKGMREGDARWGHFIIVVVQLHLLFLIIFASIYMREGDARWGRFYDCFHVFFTIAIIYYFSYLHYLYYLLLIWGKETLDKEDFIIVSMFFTIAFFLLHFSYLLFVWGGARWGRALSLFPCFFPPYLQVHLKSIVVVTYRSDVFIFAPGFVFKAYCFIINFDLYFVVAFVICSVFLISSSNF